MSATLDPSTVDDTARAIAAVFENRPDCLIEILHRLQAAVGYVPASTVQVLADALNLSRAEVHGVVTFYHDFRAHPPGRHVVRLCRAEACQSMGADALAADAQARLGISMGETTADSQVTLEPVYCLGLCATAPAAMVDRRVVGRLTQDRLRQLIDGVRA